MTRTITRGYVTLPAVTGSYTLFDENQPLGAGRMALLATNLNHLGNENSKVTCAHHPGFPYVGAQQASGFSSSGTTDLDWDALIDDDGRERDGTYVTATTGYDNVTGGLLCSGPVVLHRHGGEGQLPQVRAHWAWKAAATYTVAAQLVVTPTYQRPGNLSPGAVASAVVTETSTSLTDTSTVVSLASFRPGHIEERVITGSGASNLVAETVSYDVLYAWLLFTSTSGSKGSAGAAEVRGITIYLDYP